MSLNTKPLKLDTEVLLLNPNEDFSNWSRVHASRAKWSSAYMPEVGETFRTERHYFQKGKTIDPGELVQVTSFLLELGFVVAVCKRLSKPKSEPLYIAGCDVEAWRAGKKQEAL